jgi:predicted permease
MSLDMIGFLQDLRYAVRQFRRSPGFFAVAALLIALGVAANTQIFTLVNALLLRPLPVRDPQNLVQLFEIFPKLPPTPYFDYPLYKQLASSSPTLFHVVGQMEWTLPLEREGNSERCYAFGVTGNFFTDLGVRPLLGRVLDKDDDHAAVLSYGYWVRSFGRDPNVLGQTVRLKGHPFRIVGVTPEQFIGTIVDSGPELWIPFSNFTDFSNIANPSLDNFLIQIVARLRPGVSREQAEQETAAAWLRYMQDAAAREPQNYKGHLDRRLEVRSIANGLSPMRDQSHTALVLLLAGTGLLLLMVCANVGGLLLARATAREKETAVRLAVGASRGRIVRQWLTESLLLTFIGGGAGIAAAYGSMPLLVRWLPPARGIGIDPAELRTLSLDLHPDLRVVAFSMAVCALTAVLSAFAPAWRSSRHDLSLALKIAIGDGRQRRFQSALCAIQVALCTVLVMSAGLMARSLSNLRNVNTGFDRDRVVIFSVDPHVRGYDSQQTWSLQNRLVDGARALPGVEAAALAGRALMRGIGLVNEVVFPGQRGDGIMNTSVNSVGPEYFDVMGMHVLKGREFTAGDTTEDGALAHVIVNEAFVRRFLKGENPIGQQFATGKEFVKPQYEIIGVVNDTNYRSLREVPPPIFYEEKFGPKAYPDTFVLHVRTRGDPRSMIQPMRDLLRSIDPTVPFFQVATLSEEVDRSLWQERLLVTLASCFSIFAMTLAAIGLYGIVAYFVTARRREIGLRMALGAESGHVTWLVVRRVIPALAAGISGGAVLSLLAGTWVQSLLYGVQPFDPWSGSMALGLLLAIGLGAAAAPALRAIRIDPASTLRED